MTASHDEPLSSTHPDADALPWEFLADASKVSFGSMAALASPPLVEGARQQYRAGPRKSLIVMRSQRYFRLLDALVVMEPPAPPAGQESSAKSTIAAGLEKVRKRSKKAAEAPENERDVALHQVRKGAKRLRYTAAATGTRKVSEAAKTIQTLLGDHQDSVVSRAHLTQQADVAADAGENTFTYGLLYQREADLAKQCC
jgi:CHAD domain